MNNHVEVPFYINEISRNATVQLDRNGATITVDGAIVFVERRSVEDLIGKWNQVMENS
jgi:hypothetical protein